MQRGTPSDEFHPTGKEEENFKKSCHPCGYVQFLLLRSCCTPNKEPSYWSCMESPLLCLLTGTGACCCWDVPLGATLDAVPTLWDQDTTIFTNSGTGAAALGPRSWVLSHGSSLPSVGSTVAALCSMFHALYPKSWLWTGITEAELLLLLCPLTLGPESGLLPTTPRACCFCILHTGHCYNLSSYGPCHRCVPSTWGCNNLVRPRDSDPGSAENLNMPAPKTLALPLQQVYLCPRDPGIVVVLYVPIPRTQIYCLGECQCTRTEAERDHLVYNFLFTGKKGEQEDPSTLCHWGPPVVFAKVGVSWWSYTETMPPCPP